MEFRRVSRRLLVLLTAVLVVVAVSAFAHPAEAQRESQRQRDVEHSRRHQVGFATFYGPGFQGRETASGEDFDMREMVAAHRTLPLGSLVRVTNLENGRSIVVRVIDRGPYGRNYREGTIIDLSKRAARRLNFLRDGQVRVRVEVLKEGDDERK